MDSMDGGPPRVLVVDNDPDLVSSTLMVLQLVCGCDAQGCLDGAECLATIEAFQPDLVLLDLAMPRMSGFVVAERLRTAGLVPPLLVAVSGYGDDERRAQSLAAGFHSHELKPVSIERMRELIETAQAARHPPLAPALGS